MTHTIDEVKIFWSWFSARSENYRSLLPESEEWHQLDSRLQALGIDEWEIGPQDNGNFLAISPGGDRQKLEWTRKIVSIAPKVRGWTFFPARPPKRWSGTFEWSTRRIIINARHWQFALYKFPDGMLEVILLGNKISGLPENDHGKVLEFVIESEIGEELLIEKVCRIDIEESPPKEMLNASVELHGLRQAVESSGAN